MTSTTVDRKRKPFSNLLAALSSLALVVVLAGQSTPFIPQAQAAPINERAMIMTATLTESPASIRLDWPTRTTPPPTYNVFRRAKDAQSWGTAIASLPGTALTYTDTNIVVGQTYEYRVAASNSSSYVAYVLAGIKVPVVESRGKVVLLVESEVASALSAELALFTKDLIGDGWTVLRHDVSRDATPESARALVIADYNADRNNVNSVILFGHIPIMKAGNLAPDGHERRPFPADAYYGTMGQWTTTDLYLRSDVELQVGRIDFHNMPAFSKNATELLRQYLNKDHKYRIGQMPVTKDALISDGFGVDSVNNTANANASRLFPILWKNPQVDQGSWQTYLPNNSYTWAHIAGYGGCSLVAAVGGNITTAILAGSNYKMIFGQTLGSYSGEWDCTNNFMRATLALPEYGLTWTWVGRPNWYFHPMGLGETIGYSTKITQNAFNSGRYNDYGMMGGTIHLGLMGDPTLRMYPVFPVTNLSANATSGSTAVSWTASADTGVSNYYVYGAANENGPYTRLGIVSATSYTHTNPGSTQFYMVRASKLEQTGSGSFYNLSQGEFVKASTSVPGAFTLTYNATENGGTTTAAPAQLAGGAAVSLTPTATKSGWTFVGWNTNKDATTALSSYTMPSANATLYAIYSKTMTVTLKDFNGTTAATRTVPVTIFNKATSGSATLPTVNTYTGWTSRGWSTAISGNASVTVVSGAYSVTADATLYA
ncbi:MAG: InlB B-repeat-containing protein, partial [Propionibacteriaceae bacterium]|nr:InlB B-repeat-containing protein [Propionibacteriaceae bacterium]